MLSLVIAESALEPVPRGLWGHPSVASHARRTGRRPSDMLLDNSWHFAAMRGIRDEIKRGRPDIVHSMVAAATGSPLYVGGGLELHVHTAGDRVISFGAGVRVPRSYHRFEGLVSKLFREGRVEAAGSALLEVAECTLPELLCRLDPAVTVGLSSRGEPGTFEGIASRIPDGGCVVVGGFQKGHFAAATEGSFDLLCAAGSDPLEGHVVVSRIIYECEKTVFM